EYDSGFVRPERCIRAQLSLAEQCGAKLHMREKVLEFDIQDRVKVVTDKANYFSEQLVVTAGPWVARLVSEIGDLFTLQRQVLYWFDAARDIDSYYPGRFPVFIWELQTKQSFYGFPATDGKDGGLKFASEATGQIIASPDAVNRKVSEAEIRNIYNSFIAPNVSGISDH